MAKSASSSKPSATKAATTTTVPKVEVDDDESSSSSDDKLSPDKVVILGCLLLGIGMVGFYFLDGMIANDAGGSHLINAFYCSVMTLTTIGFGDICPSEPDFVGRIFLTVLPILGLGFFCGPLLDLTSTWQNQVPGGVLALSTLTLAMGISMLTVLENLSYTDATHLCIITGTTIGYGDITPSTDLGRLSLAIYAILVLNVMGGLLDITKNYLLRFCQNAKTKSTKANDDDKKEK